MGASDSCLETSICLPAFIPDHSYEIKFNKNLFLRHQRNEIQPFLNKWTQWDRTAEETSCSTCISQVRHLVPLRMRETARFIYLSRFFTFFSGCRCPAGDDAPFPGQSIVQPFQSESPSPLLSEIGNPFSWTRFLASSRDCKGDMLQALDCKWTRIQLEFWSSVFEFLNLILFYLYFFPCAPVCNILEKSEHFWAALISVLRFFQCIFLLSWDIALLARLCL